MVLPKELRARAGIKTGDTFAVTSWEKDGEICRRVLLTVENREARVKEVPGPVMKDILQHRRIQCRPSNS